MGVVLLALLQGCWCAGFDTQDPYPCPCSLTAASELLYAEAEAEADVTVELTVADFDTRETWARATLPLSTEHGGHVLEETEVLTWEATDDAPRYAHVEGLLLVDATEVGRDDADVSDGTLLLLDGLRLRMRKDCYCQALSCE